MVITAILYILDIIRDVSRRLSRRRRLKIFNFFRSSAAAVKNSLAIDGGWKMSIFFALSAAAAGNFSVFSVNECNFQKIFRENFLFWRNLGSMNFAVVTFAVDFWQLPKVKFFAEAVI